MSHLPEVENVLSGNEETREAYFGKTPVPPGITFEIKEIRIVADDSKRKRAHLTVLVSFGKSSWHKHFRFPIDGIITFDTQRARLQEEVSKDFRIDRAISELVENKGKEFPLFDIK